MKVTKEELKKYNNLMSDIKECREKYKKAIQLSRDFMSDILQKYEFEQYVDDYEINPDTGEIFKVDVLYLDRL